MSKLGENGELDKTHCTAIDGHIDICSLILSTHGHKFSQNKTTCAIFAKFCIVTFH